MEPRKDVTPPAQIRSVLGRFWTVANMLSLARILLVGPVVYIILTDGPLSWLFGLVLLGVATDWLDGRIARWSKTVSDWGKVLDPLADKVAAVSLVLALAIRGDLPLWFLAVLIVRDVLIVIGGVVVTRRTGRVLMSLWVGKVAVSLVALTILAALLKADPPVLQVCIWASTFLLVLSWAIYLRRALQTIRKSSEMNLEDVVPSDQASLSSQAQSLSS